ncbi:hypothetical protein GRF29_1536g190397 [Pseudopithomyces chartarum]|uniref:Protein kinase domain-containing protein n=1 Tax=Pseudopithomyces chartarum TaxID=1892770 RepID=A0AAN6LKK3_9PLEO|nr:hypothetical protein GRF29_1536g190397 [Pseudopithomyces chartarum]
MDKEASTWTLMDYVFDPTRTRLILQVHVQYSNWLEIIVHLPNKKQEAPTGSWQSMLLQLVTPTKTSSKDDAHGIIKRILQLCRDRYAQGWPLFGNSIYVIDGAGEPELLEAMESELELALRAAPRLETDGYSIPLTPRQDMQPAVVEEGSFMPQTKPVWFQGKLCVAKGPASAERAHLDLREVSNLCSLPTRHPNIIPPPLSLLTLSETDKTICGFLFPLYKHGNLDLFALKMCREDSHFSHILRAWYRQLASAVKSLIDADTYHGDIKPDNILVSDANELILIDLARSFTTLSIAGPEVVEGSTDPPYNHAVG